MTDRELLAECDIKDGFSPNSEEERQQCIRLIKEGDLERIPVPPMPGDPNIPFACKLTAQGKAKVRDKS